jgi:hypothetical protein
MERICSGATPAAAREVAPPARIECPEKESAKKQWKQGINQERKGSNPSLLSQSKGCNGNFELREARNHVKRGSGSDSAGTC